ncbi:FMN-binding split barrel-related protein [Penicillium bovifimosum]|uniref:FMN-binding split barrel-related protein n=1 Tax=Penicillium bovifimosum TaxID=126998 RepID=A0A9W9L8T9_9EURO|nr:FMN-binding split barrel-related protein [Penicillium bovifimosum]KAJ5142754.1 FMN-binding split barrel-related protein [Penicillium bovifimosum]
MFFPDCKEKLSQLESSGHAIEAWHIKATAYSIEDLKRENEQQEEASRADIYNSLRVKGGNGQDVEGWTWENAITKYFANHSPVARDMCSP